MQDAINIKGNFPMVCNIRQSYQSFELNIDAKTSKIISASSILEIKVIKVSYKNIIINKSKLYDIIAYQSTRIPKEGIILRGDAVLPWSWIDPKKNKTILFAVYSNLGVFSSEQPIDPTIPCTYNILIIRKGESLYIQAKVLHNKSKSIIIIEDTSPNNQACLIINTTDVPIRYYLNDAVYKPLEKNKYNPIYWSNSMVDPIVKLLIGESNKGDYINFNTLPKSLEVSYKKGYQQVSERLHYRVVYEGKKQILEFSNKPVDIDLSKVNNTFTFINVSMPLIGISFIYGDTHQTKEIMYATIHSLQSIIMNNAKMRKLALYISKLQIDNCTESNAFTPTLLITKPNPDNFIEIYIKQHINNEGIFLMDRAIVNISKIYILLDDSIISYMVGLTMDLMNIKNSDKYLLSQILIYSKGKQYLSPILNQTKKLNNGAVTPLKITNFYVSPIKALLQYHSEKEQRNLNFFPIAKLLITILNRVPFIKINANFLLLSSFEGTTTDLTDHIYNFYKKFVLINAVGNAVSSMVWLSILLKVAETAIKPPSKLKAVQCACPYTFDKLQSKFKNSLISVQNIIQNVSIMDNILLQTIASSIKSYNDSNTIEKLNLFSQLNHFEEYIANYTELHEVYDSESDLIRNWIAVKESKSNMLITQIRRVRPFYGEAFIIKAFNEEDAEIYWMIRQKNKIDHSILLKSEFSQNNGKLVIVDTKDYLYVINDGKVHEAITKYNIQSVKIEGDKNLVITYNQNHLVML